MAKPVYIQICINQYNALDMCPVFNNVEMNQTLSSATIPEKRILSY